MNRNTSGILYVIATPIGNRSDITLRAIEILKTVDLIAAEDTRHSISLLQYLGISKPLLSLHEHNEQEETKKLVLRLLQGDSIGLISDAGTPLISDPGYHLISAVRSEGIKIIPIPGACAAITALSVAGLPTDRFIFEGFLPVKTRKQRLEALVDETRTMIFYEAPHRIKELLGDMKKMFGGERQVVIARELTKLFETIYGGSLDHVIDWMLNDANQQKGEFVIIVKGSEKVREEKTTTPADTILKLLLNELPVKKAAELTAKITGKRKNDLYQQALKLKSSHP